MNNIIRKKLIPNLKHFLQKDVLGIYNHENAPQMKIRDIKVKPGKNGKIRLDKLFGKQGFGSGAYNVGEHAVYTSRVVHAGSDEATERQRNVLDSLNKLVSGKTLAHEEYHSKTNKYIENTFGFSKHDEVKIFVHYELAARVAGLLKLREDFSNGFNDVDLEIIDKLDIAEHGGNYLQWLQNQEELSKTPNAEESEILLDGAIKEYAINNWMDWDIKSHFKGPDSMIKRPFRKIGKMLADATDAKSYTYEESVQGLYNEFLVNEEKYNPLEEITPETKTRLEDWVSKTTSKHFKDRSMSQNKIHSDKQIKDEILK